MRKCTGCGAGMDENEDICSYCGTSQKTGQVQEFQAAPNNPQNEYQNYMPVKKPFYTSGWFIWLMLIFLCPVGLFLLFKYSKYENRTKIIISFISVLIFIAAVTPGNHSAQTDDEKQSETSTVSNSSLSNDQKAEKLYQDAQAAFEKDNYDTAISKLNTIIKDYPGSPKAADATSLLSEVQSVKAKSVWISAGMYKVGTDIPAGEYVLTCTGSSSYFEITSDSTGKLDSIIANDNISTHTYLTVADGQYLKVKNGKIKLAAYCDPFKPSNGSYEEGMYKIGVDIPAGEYKLVATGSTPAYMEIDENSNNTLDNIISNDNFSGEIYVTVQAGQYLKFNRAKLIVN